MLGHRGLNHSSPAILSSGIPAQEKRHALLAARVWCLTQRQPAIFRLHLERPYKPPDRANYQCPTKRYFFPQPARLPCVRKYQQATPRLRSRAWLKQREDQSSSLGSDISIGSPISVIYRATNSKKVRSAAFLACA